MTRITTWLLGTITAVTLLFGYHTSTSGPTTATGTVVAAPAVPQSTSSDTGTSSSGTGTAASGTGTRTLTGAVAQTRWGPVQVRVTEVGGKITAVDVLESPNGNGRAQEINARALPVLTSETLSAQNADIDMVSGATVTSGGYLQSLQSALDQAAA